MKLSDRPVPLPWSSILRSNGTGRQGWTWVIGRYHFCDHLYYVEMVQADSVELEISAGTSSATIYTTQKWYRPIVMNLRDRPVPLLWSSILRRNGTGRQQWTWAIGRYHFCDHRNNVEMVPADNNELEHLSNRPVWLLWPLILSRNGIGQYNFCDHPNYLDVVPANSNELHQSASITSATICATWMWYRPTAMNFTNWPVPVLRPSILPECGMGWWQWTLAIGHFLVSVNQYLFKCPHLCVYDIPIPQ